MNFYFEIQDGNLHLFHFYDDLIINLSLVAGVCVGLPALIWAFRVFYTLRKHGGQISAFIILLIISDLAELLLSAIIASYLIDNLVKFCATKSLKTITEEMYRPPMSILLLIRLLITFRIVGLFLHQLVALESILYLKKQVFSAHVFSPLCSTISCIILWLLVFGCQFLMVWFNLLFTFLPCCILVITCTLTGKASPAPDRIKPGLAVVIVSRLTFITFCGTVGLMFPFNIRNILYFHGVRSDFSYFLISLRVILDPLLCVLVCKEQLMVHKQQTHTEMNADQRSV